MTTRRRPPRRPGLVGGHPQAPGVSSVTPAPVGLVGGHPQAPGVDPSGVILEQMHAHFKVVIEALQECPTRAQMDARFDQVDARFDRVEGRLDRVEGRLDGVEGRLDRVEGRLDGVEGRLGRVESEVRGLRDDLVRKADASLLIALDQRVTVLERRLG